MRDDVAIKTISRKSSCQTPLNNMTATSKFQEPLIKGGIMGIFIEDYNVSVPIPWHWRIV